MASRHPETDLSRALKRRRRRERWGRVALVVLGCLAVVGALQLLLVGLR
jgi:hypothetical protein